MAQYLAFSSMMENLNNIFNNKLKLILALVVGILFLGSMSNSAQVKAQNDTYEIIGKAIAVGNSDLLGTHLNTKIDMVIEGKKSSYSKNQATFVLKDFFKKYPPSNFEFVHRGDSKTGLRYAIGKYYHSQGSFRVVIRTKKLGNADKLYNLDFSKE